MKDTVNEFQISDLQNKANRAQELKSIFKMTPNTDNMELAKLWRNIGPFDVEEFLRGNPESVDLSLNV